MKLSIIIPAYNEEKRIGKTLHEFYDYFKKYKNFEIIVVTDGCTDGTLEIVRSMCNRHIKSLNFPRKLGKGRAVINGLKTAKGKIIGYVDADESILPKDFSILIKNTKNYDCVIASRRIKGSEILKKQPIRRRVMSRIYNYIVNFLFGLGIKDTQCGAKVFKRDVIKDILNDIKLTGYAFDVEILWKIKKKGYSIKEYPIEWMHVKEGQFKLLKHGLSMLIDVLRLRFCSHSHSNISNK